MFSRDNIMNYPNTGLRHSDLITDFEVFLCYYYDNVILKNMIKTISYLTVYN